MTLYILSARTDDYGTPRTWLIRAYRTQAEAQEAREALTHDRDERFARDPHSLSADDAGTTWFIQEIPLAEDAS